MNSGFSRTFIQISLRVLYSFTFFSLILATTSAGLVIHVIYPLKPPRMMAGFVDTAAVIGPDPYELGISGGANQLAAMPSLHVGWALLIALGTIWISTSNARWLV